VITTGSIDDSYKSSTYDQLSKEFRELFRKAVRAFQLIPLMYDRLTEIDGLSHKEARTKILDDHKDLPGFTTRNFYRYLPTDNPNIPRRVVTPRHKNSTTKPTNEKTFSTTESDFAPDTRTDDKLTTSECSSCLELRNTVKELSEALSKTTKLPTADTLIESDLAANRDSSLVRGYPKETRDILEFEFHLLFGDLSRQMAPLYPKIGDAGKVWFSGRIDKNTGKVLFVRLGRIEES
jgi:hypothetical protein